MASHIKKAVRINVNGKILKVWDRVLDEMLGQGLERENVSSRINYISVLSKS